MSVKGETFLQMKAITKGFPKVLANHNVSFDVREGEVHGILGENGAGKSTLMKILYGLYRPDEGEIWIKGNKVEITSPNKAVELGIGMVHQHFMLVENMTALENVLLGLKQEKPPFLNKEQAKKKFKELATTYDLNIDHDIPVWNLTVGEQQWLEILKLLFRDVQLLVLDEPTAVLTPTEVAKLFRTIRKLTDEGRSVIFISHKLDEVKEICDRLTVLRDGCVIDTIDPKETTPSELAMMMVGRPITLGRKPRNPIPDPHPVLEVENISCLNDRGLTGLKDVSFTLQSGEILGIAGVDGNGQKELAECITGLRKLTQGKIKINGNPVHHVVTDTSILGNVPEDRHRTGVILDFTVAENLVLKTVGSETYTKNGLVSWKKVSEHADELMRKYDVKAPNSNVKVETLSGGNQQRVVLARELHAAPDLLVCSQPTRGLDYGAVDALHEILLEERARGAAILFISTELSEVVALSDRLMVFHKGESMGCLEAETAPMERIGEMMLGRKYSPSQEDGAQL
ncbi:MAG: ABC transporter ATP-binding protein [Anaerolineaceae bacterium]|jgi:ABC-type uncharacterized transport system ATPase subunit